MLLRFHPRCPYSKLGLCDVGGPPLMKHMSDGRAVACLRAEDIWRGKATAQEQVQA